MEAADFDHAAFFRAVAGSGARALLIGRRALVALGLPVLTSDYDFWVHPDDAPLLNDALAPLDFSPTRTPDEARRFGRYALEDGVRIDVRIARVVPTTQGERIAFDDLWARRKEAEVVPGVVVPLPAIPDLIATRRFADRPRDLEDIRLLEAILGGTREEPR